MVKPFLPLELVARVKALFRRSDIVAEASFKRGLSLGNIQLNQVMHSFHVAEKECAVTPIEYEFMRYMLECSGRAVSKKEILKEIWHIENTDLNTRIADDMIKRLRKKLRQAECNVQIETVWGYGFKLVEIQTGGFG